MNETIVHIVYDGLFILLPQDMIFSVMCCREKTHQKDSNHQVTIKARICLVRAFLFGRNNKK